eukprot:199744-Lingulodinium_polyedra.AAC.1
MPGGRLLLGPDRALAGGAALALPCRGAQQHPRSPSGGGRARRGHARPCCLEQAAPRDLGQPGRRGRLQQGTELRAEPASASET